MRKLWTIVFLTAISAWLTGCGVVGNSKESGTPTITNAFTSISAGSAAVKLGAVGKNGPQPVDWSLTYATQPCAPACGTLAPLGSSGATYTPPAAAPQYGQAAITAFST